MKQVNITLPNYKRGFHIITDEIIKQLPQLPHVGLLHLFIELFFMISFNFKKLISLLLLLTFFNNSYCQIPQNKKIDWSKAGDKIQHAYLDTINVLNYGMLGDGVFNNDTAFSNILGGINNSSVIYFPQGEYLFKSGINLPNDIVLLGESSGSTKLIFDLSIAGYNLIHVKGNVDSIHFDLIEDSFVHQDWIRIPYNLINYFHQNDYIILNKNDSAYVFSNWALNSVGQINQVKAIIGDTLFLYDKLRIDFTLNEIPYIRKIDPIKNVGISCLTIERQDSISIQKSNILFEWAVNCFVIGVESKNCIFSHVSMYYSSNISVSSCFFHDSFYYTGGGNGYGVNILGSSGNCLIENNIFEHLRHSMIVHAGANGNVFGYNYSLTPYWDEVGLPNDGAGDIVLHGNYPFYNLFEGNIVQNIVVDDSHGINGVNNVFYRNRAENYGVFMNNTYPTDSCVFVGNEITSNALGHGLFFINGVGHFIYGNNVKGICTPANTENILDTSLYLKHKPYTFNDNQYPFCGYPKNINQDNNNAYYNYAISEFTNCTNSYLKISKFNYDKILFYPNPCSGVLYFSKPCKVTIFNTNGIEVLTSNWSSYIDISQLADGIYILYYGNTNDYIKILKSR